MELPLFENCVTVDINNNNNKNHKYWDDENFRKLRLCRANVGQTMRDMQACRDYLRRWSSVFWRTENECDENLNADTLTKNRKKLEHFIQKHKLRPSQVYYLDEVLLRLMVPKDGSMVKGECVRVLLCANTIGDHKLTISVLGKFDQTPYETLPLHYCSPNSEWSPSLFEKWFSSFFVREVSSFLLNKKLPPKAVLLTSRQRGVYESEEGNFCTMCLPPDIELIEELDPMYKNLRSVFGEKIQILIEENDPNIKNSIMYAAVRAWEYVESNSIRKVFTKMINFVIEKVISKKGAKVSKNIGLAIIPENDHETDMEVDVEMEDVIDNTIDSSPSIIETNGNDERYNDKHSLTEQISHYKANESMKVVLSYFEQHTGANSIEYLILKKIKQTITENRKRKSKYTIENSNKRQRN